MDPRSVCSLCGQSEFHIFFHRSLRIKVDHPVVPRVTTREPHSLVDTASLIMWPSPHDFSKGSTKCLQINFQSPFLTLTIITEMGASAINLSHVSGHRANFLGSARNILLGSQRPLCISPCGRRLPLYIIFHLSCDV